MHPLRQRMIEDMQLRGFSARTQECYVAAVRQLAEHFHQNPGQLTEEDLRQYCRWLLGGVDIETVRDLLGHASVQTTQRYLRGIKFDRHGHVDPRDAWPRRLIGLVSELEEVRQATQ